MIVLDSNVVSELMKSTPDTGVTNWLTACPGDQLATTSITVAEIGAGIEVMPQGARKRGLQALWFQLLADGFGDRVYSFDRDAATVYGELFALRRRAGKPGSPFDLQIVSIARTRGCSVATRNVKHFEDCGVEVINPWSAAPA
jgi:toxin FitB